MRRKSQGENVYPKTERTKGGIPGSVTFQSWLKRTLTLSRCLGSISLVSSWKGLAQFGIQKPRHPGEIPVNSTIWHPRLIDTFDHAVPITWSTFFPHSYILMIPFATFKTHLVKSHLPAVLPGSSLFLWTLFSRTPQHSVGTDFAFTCIFFPLHWTFLSPGSL